MFRAKPILGFLCRFVIVFGLLVAPWPGWRETYARYLARSVMAVAGLFGPTMRVAVHVGAPGSGTTMVFASLGSKGIFTFGSNPTDNKKLDTIYVGNRAQLATRQNKSMACRIFSPRLACFHTALVIALILATDISWRRRLCALAWGLMWIHVFIAFLLGLMIVLIILNNPWLGLFEVSPFLQKIMSFLCVLFLNHGGARYATIVLIWIAVTFRREDWINLLSKQEAGDGKQGQRV